MQTIFDKTNAAQSDTESSCIEAAMNLERLVQAVTLREVAALSRLYELTIGHVFAIAYFKLRSREDAEEIVIDVYNYVWQHSVAYDANRGSVRAWLAIMTRNRAIDRLRRRRDLISLNDEQHAAFAESLVGMALGPEQTVSFVQSSTALHRALERLSAERQSLLRLAFFEGLTHEEIAVTVGMPLGTVKSHVRRALAAMQRHLAMDAKTAFDG